MINNMLNTSDNLIMNNQKKYYHNLYSGKTRKHAMIETKFSIFVDNVIIHQKT